MRFLIAYSSRYGSTEEIALRLAGLPVEEGVDAIVLDVKKNSSWPSLEGYDGVIMGSGVKITRWMREPLEFLRRKKDEFRGRRLALFVSCMSVLTDSDYAWEELLEGGDGESGGGGGSVRGLRASGGHGGWLQDGVPG